MIAEGHPDTVVMGTFSLASQELPTGLCVVQCLLPEFWGAFTRGDSATGETTGSGPKHSTLSQLWVHLKCGGERWRARGGCAGLPPTLSGWQLLAPAPCELNKLNVWLGGCQTQCNQQPPGLAPPLKGPALLLCTLPSAARLPRHSHRPGRTRLPAGPSSHTHEPVCAAFVH